VELKRDGEDEAMSLEHRVTLAIRATFVASFVGVILIYLLLGSAL